MQYNLGYMFSLSLKCPYYAFSNMTFYAVCNIAVCKCKRVLKIKVQDKKTYCHLKERIDSEPLKRVIGNSSLTSCYIRT